MLLSTISTTEVPEGYGSMFWVVGMEGSDRVLVGKGVGAQWSPGGTRVIVTSVGPGCSPELTSVKPDGTDATVLPFDLRIGDGPFWWSPDGAHVAFIRYRDPVACKHASAGLPLEPWVMDADGSHQRRLATDGRVTWSPDGQHLTLARASDPNGPWDSLSVIDLAGTVLASVGPEPGVSYGDAIWSPDGTRLVFGRFGAGDEERSLLVADWDLAGLAALDLPSRSFMDGARDWSPNGSAVLVAFATEDVRALLWIIGADGQPARRLSPADADEVGADWSPSGLSIAVARKGAAPDGIEPGVLVMNLDGVGLVTLGAGQDPLWQPDLQPDLNAP
ncbi:MAG: hypothetical protein OEW24_08255 [Chloroflexota bacterium]|nr:hypothetical protein [Chloroflexota bacterium]